MGLAAMLLGACFDFDATMADGPLADGGPTGLDAGLDATLADGSPPADANHAGDASGDAGGPPTTDAGPFCPPPPSEGGIFFCDDFDEDPLPGKWNTVGETGGTLAETDASAVSKPNSLDETTMPASNGQVVNVALREFLSVPSVPATLRFAFAVEPVQIDVTANAAIVLGAVDFLDAAGNRYSVGLAINVSGAAPALALGEQSGFIDGGIDYVSHPLLPTEPLAMNAWSEVVIEIDWTAATTANGIVIVNGTQELDVPLTITVQPTELQIGVGTSYVSEPAPIWELRYDNVVFTAP